MALQELKKKKKKNGKNAGASHRTERLAKPPSLELRGTGNRTTPGTSVQEFTDFFP